MSLHVHAVAKRYGDNVIFENLDYRLGRGEKAALTGPNGSGKSTLLHLIAGLEQPDSGSVKVGGTVSLLPQHAQAAELSVLEAVTPPRLLEAERKLLQAQARLADPDERRLADYSDAEERYRLLGGYEFSARASSVLDGLQLAAGANVARLSGGQQRRVMLAGQLLAPADLLLLDEPTNHLDAASLVWLEEWVRSNAATILLVSHDRAFLDATVSSVAELERGRLKVYPGNYSEAMQVKAAEREAQQRQYDAQQRSKQALKAESGRLASQARSAGKFNRKRAGNQALILAKAKAENASRTLARRARALEQRLERAEEVEKPFDDRTVLQVPLPEVPVGPVEVLRIEQLGLSRGGKALLVDFSLTLRRGEKLALLGENGSGKSSLIKAIAGRFEPQAGSISLGAGLSVFHAGQHNEELQEFTTLADALHDAQATLRRQDLYSLLARLGLPPDPGFRVADLSGGQRTRLALARLAVTRASLLLLDEPTNHLDLRAIEALEELLCSYPGTVLLASHDRRLVEAVTNREPVKLRRPGS